MRFEHLIEINDPLIPLIEPLTRAQLWRGLERRAHAPLDFRPDFDRCITLDEGLNWRRYELVFGGHAFIEEVRLDPPHGLTFRIVGDDPHAGSELQVAIEEPAPGALWARFRYDTVITDSGDAAPEFDRARRAAYRDADIDTIRRLRQLAAAGELG